jgi:hypothetical protein
MLESEKTVHERAHSSDEIPRHVCLQLLSSKPRYALWHARHEGTMYTVAEGRRRDLQILRLRAVAVEQVHRTALTRYLRDHSIRGSARDEALREFYGVVDSRRAAITEHRNYLLAASTQLCATDLLELVGDDKGVDLVRMYESTYGQYFGMFCDRARAARRRAPYLLGALIPEARAGANRIRERILSGELLPSQRMSFARAS